MYTFNLKPNTYHIFTQKIDDMHLYSNRNANKVLNWNECINNTYIESNKNSTNTEKRAPGKGLVWSVIKSIRHPLLISAQTEKKICTLRMQNQNKQNKHKTNNKTIAVTVRLVTRMSGDWWSSFRKTGK